MSEREEPRMLLCDGCGQPVREDAAADKVEPKGGTHKRCFYCKRCARDRGLSTGRRGPKIVDLGPI